jgi:hypothetical protein
MNWLPVWKQIGWKQVGKSLKWTIESTPPAAALGAAVGAAVAGAAVAGAAVAGAAVAGAAVAGAAVAGAAVAGAAVAGAAVGAVVAPGVAQAPKTIATVAKSTKIRARTSTSSNTTGATPTVSRRESGGSVAFEIPDFK